MKKKSLFNIRYYFIFLCSFIFCLKYNAQEQLLSKKALEKIFKHNSKQDLPSDYVNMWTSCNTDSTYYKSDTVVIYNWDNYKCHQYLQWKFRLKEKNIIYYYFKNKRYGDFGTNGINYKLKVKEEKGELFIEIYEYILAKGKNDLVEKFKVISLRKEPLKGGIDPVDVLVLKRICYNKPMTIEEFNNWIMSKRKK